MTNPPDKHVAKHCFMHNILKPRRLAFKPDPLIRKAMINNVCMDILAPMWPALCNAFTSSYHA